jgi:hypothetical protein
MTDRPFYLLIEDEIERRANQSDADLLRDLDLLSPLPDEYVWFGSRDRNNPAWDEPDTEQQLITFLAMAGLVAERKLREGVSLLLEKASYGDVGETMRGLRHSLEKAYADDWSGLVDVCIKAAQHERPGTRLWATRELGVLRDSRALPVLFDAIYDRASLVRDQAILSLSMVIRAQTAQTALAPQVKGQIEAIAASLGRTHHELQMLMAEINENAEAKD